MISNKHKGDLFEDRVFRIISNLVRGNKLPYINKKCAKIFRQKEYYSKDRKSNIKTDISIETRFDDSSDISFLCIIECKDLGHNVPIDDVEEFYSKVDQIAGKNVKAVMVSSRPFQKSAFNYAEAKKIGVMRVSRDNEFGWDLPRESVNACEDRVEDIYDLMYHLVDDEKNKQSNVSLGQYNDVLYRDISGLLGHIIDDLVNCNESWKLNFEKEELVPIDIPYLSEESLERYADELLCASENSAIPVQIEKLQKYLSSEFGCEFEYEQDLGFNSNDKKILGKISLDNNEIWIDKSIRENEARFRFTFAHEAAHLILHKPILVDNRIYENEEDEDTVVSDASLSRMQMKRIEIQANIFASALLMPYIKFIEIALGYAKELGLVNRGYGIIFVDDQACNKSNYMILTSKLMDTFKVSRESITLRLMKLGILNDVRNAPTKINNIWRMG